MEIYAQYASVEKQIKALEEQKKALREEIINILPEDGVKNDFVTANWRVSKTINYPEDVKILENNVKEALKPIEEEYKSKIKPLTDSIEVAKKLAEENGTVTVEEKRSLVVTVK